MYLDGKDFNYYNFSNIIVPNKYDGTIILVFISNEKHYSCLFPLNNYNIFEKDSPYYIENVNYEKEKERSS